MKKLSIILLLIGSLGLNSLYAQKISKKAEKVEQKRRAQKMKYFYKLLSVSPRADFGIGFHHSRMTYQIPSLNNQVQEVQNELKGQYPWVPWKDVEIENGNPERTRSLRKGGEFYFTGGLNLPVIFIEVEAGIGKFSDPFLTIDKVFPPWKLTKKDEIEDILVDRILSTDPKASFNLRIGGELERLLPEYWQPRMKVGFVEIGLDASAYFTLGFDMSYRPGVELIAPEATNSLESAFQPIPVISDNMKSDAARAIINRIEQKIPTYLWAPASRGYGIGTEAYVNLGRSMRLSIHYRHERSRGLRLNELNWMMRGPKLKRDYLTIGIHTRI